MIALLAGVCVALVASFVLTPLLIGYLTRHHFGQFIRQDGPQSHQVKRGTPTMGGLVIMTSTLLGWLTSTLVMWVTQGRGPRASAMLVLFLMVGMGMVGFLDDFTKIRRQRSLGLTPVAKIVGQGIVGVLFALGALQFPDAHGITPGSTRISFLRDTGADLAGLGWGTAARIGGIVLFIIWANFLITAWTNAVNLTDGLDGLASGTSIIAFGAYALVCFWKYAQGCAMGPESGVAPCYAARDPWDLTIVAAIVGVACLGFLWWNTSPAQIFMGDTGSLALGGAFAGISILSQTEFLAVLLGGVFVLEVLSDVIQVGYFKMTGKRVFKMAPIHHHFELLGWREVTIVTRFWIVAGLAASLGLVIFYGEWAVGIGVGG